MSDRSTWKAYKFSEIAENILDRTMPLSGDELRYIGLEHMESGSLHISQWGSKTELIGEKLKIQQGDVLFAKRNAYLKRAPAGRTTKKGRSEYRIHPFSTIFEIYCL